MSGVLHAERSNGKFPVPEVIREREGVELRPGVQKAPMKALGQGLHRSQRHWAPPGELELWQKGELGECSRSQTPGKGKKRKDNLNRSRLPLFRQEGVTVGLTEGRE